MCVCLWISLLCLVYQYSFRLSCKFFFLLVVSFFLLFLVMVYLGQVLVVGCFRKCTWLYWEERWAICPQDTPPSHYSPPLFFNKLSAACRKQISTVHKSGGTDPLTSPDSCREVSLLIMLLFAYKLGHLLHVTRHNSNSVMWPTEQLCMSVCRKQQKQSSMVLACRFECDVWAR